jgi:hypothetical protein
MTPDKPTPTPSEVPTSRLKVSHHPAAHIAPRYYYAAYGSNLSFEQMSERCPRAEVITAGKLIGQRLAFSRVATIIDDDKATTLVGIFQLTPNDVEALDRREGLGRVYDRYLVTPLTADGRALRCFTYIKKDATPAEPSDAYYQRIALGFRDWSFDDRRLRHARKRAQKEALALKLANKAAHQFVEDRHWAKDWYQSQQGDLPFYETAKTTSLVTGREISVARFASAATKSVEWGVRDGVYYWRMKNSRAWYRDVSTESDIASGIARGEIDQSLPGAKAFIPKDDNKGKSH